MGGLVTISGSCRSYLARPKREIEKLFPALWRAVVRSLADLAWSLKGGAQASEYFFPLNLRCSAAG